MHLPTNRVIHFCRNTGMPAMASQLCDAIADIPIFYNKALIVQKIEVVWCIFPLSSPLPSLSLSLTTPTLPWLLVVIVPTAEVQPKARKFTTFVSPNASGSIKTTIKNGLGE